MLFICLHVSLFSTILVSFDMFFWIFVVFFNYWWAWWYASKRKKKKRFAIIEPLSTALLVLTFVLVNLSQWLSESLLSCPLYHGQPYMLTYLSLHGFSWIFLCTYNFCLFPKSVLDIFNCFLFFSFFVFAFLTFFKYLWQWWYSPAARKLGCTQTMIWGGPYVGNYILTAAPIHTCGKCKEFGQPAHGQPLASAHLVSAVVSQLVCGLLLAAYSHSFYHIHIFFLLLPTGFNFFIPPFFFVALIDVHSWFLF